MNIPAEFSITELAMVLGVSRHVIERRVMTCVIRCTKPGTGKNAKRVIRLNELKDDHPELWNAILARAQLVRPFEPVEEDE